MQQQTKITKDGGLIPAEQIVFYESGNIKRVFPLNGKITGYWTEEDEYSLAGELTFSFSFGSIKNKLISVYFYDGGGIKSMTFWPKEITSLETPIGTMENRIGLSLYSNGKLKSCEPNKPLNVPTPIGGIMAYNPDVLGIHGDTNSLVFNEDGTIKSIITSVNQIAIRDENGVETIFEPGFKPSLFNPEKMDLVPLRIEFYNNTIRIQSINEGEYDISKYCFSIKPYINKRASSCSDCASCTDCG